MKKLQKINIIEHGDDLVKFLFLTYLKWKLLKISHEKTIYWTLADLYVII